MATVAKPALSGVGHKDGFFIHRIQKGYAAWIGLPIWPVVMDNTCGINLHSRIALGYSLSPAVNSIWVPV